MRCRASLEGCTQFPGPSTRPPERDGEGARGMPLDDGRMIVGNDVAELGLPDIAPFKRQIAEEV